MALTRPVAALKPTTVAICRGCWEWGERFYLPVEDAGTTCDWHEGRPRKLVKRRLYICDQPGHCEEQYGFLTHSALLIHQSDTPEG